MAFYRLTIILGLCCDDAMQSQQRLPGRWDNRRTLDYAELWMNYAWSLPQELSVVVGVVVVVVGVVVVVVEATFFRCHNNPGMLENAQAKSQRWQNKELRKPQS